MIMKAKKLGMVVQAVIPALRRPRLEDCHEFKTNLNIARPYLKK